CFEFDGDLNSKIQAGDVQELDGASEFTVDTWIYIDQWVSGAFVFRKQESDWQTRISMSLGALATKRMYFHISDGANKYMAVDNSSISVGNWHHVVVSYNGNDPAFSQIKVYIDGAIVSNKWFSMADGLLPSVTPSTNGSFEIGSKFKGKLDEFRLWSKALSLSEIERTNTINSYHPDYHNLALYYRGDQLQASSAVDYANSYNGAIAGNVTKSEVTDNNIFTYKIVSAYVRESDFHRGLLNDEYILNNNDLIFIGGIEAKANGDIYLKYPDNDGTLVGTNYLNQYFGRDGVLEFTGQGAQVNCGKGLFYKKADVGAKVFTFEAWVYVDEWVENSNIFIRSSDWLNKLSISLGS
ncbi:MAG: LamG domain-containing protein, partial [Pseudomonadales bacterium]|nr:LamG domain-containing protein [Pseudomonadales bacterium]